MKRKIIFTLGILISFFGLFLFFLGIGMVFDVNAKAAEAGLPIAVFSFSFITIGGLMLYWAQNESKKDVQIQLVVSTVKTYRRISMEKLSGLTSLAPVQLRKIIGRAINRQLLAGYFDRGSDEFYTGESEKQKSPHKFCAVCGAPLGRVYYEGETIRCEHCGAVM